MNGLAEVTNTWHDDCLVVQELRYDGSPRGEDRTFTCDEHGHAWERTSTYFSVGDDGVRVETIGTDEYTYGLSYSGADWTEWTSPVDGWSFELDFVNTQLLSTTWDYYRMSIVGTSRYTWEDESLVAVDHTDVDTENDFTWDYHTTWTYDDAGRVVSRDDDGKTSSWRYVGDDPRPQEEAHWTGNRYAITFDCG